MTRAFIVVDVQNDFADPRGSLYVKSGENAVPIINNLTRRAVEQRDIIVFSRDWHPFRSKHFEKFGGRWPVHCVVGTDGSAFYEDLIIPANSIIASKGIMEDTDGYSAFDQDVTTGVVLEVKGGWRWLFNGRDPLDIIFRKLAIWEVTIAGLATDYCVKATALETVKLTYKAKVVIDACRAVNINPDDEYGAIEEMKAAGVEIVTSEDILARKT